MNLKTQIAQTNDLNKALQLAAEASSGTKGVLRMADGVFRAMIYLESGRVVAASVEGKNLTSSLQALQEIMQHHEAVFLYEAGAAPIDLKRVNFPFQELLKEGLNLTERNEPVDPSVVGKNVDRDSMNTLTNSVLVDPRLFEDKKDD